MEVTQGDVYWAELGQPHGSEPGYRRPVVIVQCNRINATSISTVVCIVLTSNLSLADAPGNVLLSRDQTELGKDSVANTSQIVTLDRDELETRICKLSSPQIKGILTGIATILGLELR